MMAKVMKYKFILLVAAVIVILAVYLNHTGKTLKDLLSFKNDSQGETKPTGETAKKDNYQRINATDNTVFTVKNPMIYDEKVGKIQRAYNLFAEQMKKKFPSVTYEKITADNVFGKKTLDAINSVGGNNYPGVSWNMTKAAIKIFSSAYQLNITEDILNSI